MMEIKKLQLSAKSITKQLHFFKDVLGFPTEQLNNEEIVVRSGMNQLHFKKSDNNFVYHYAWLIPTGTIHSAINFLEKKNIELLPFQGKKIIDFGTGQAIYFFDGDGNIAEFIERPSLGISSNKPFTIDQVVKLNEIGMPVENPLSTAATLVEDHGIVPIEPQIMREDFCWVGDYNGVLIVAKEGRVWMPTKIPSVQNDLSIWYEENGMEYHLEILDK